MTAFLEVENLSKRFGGLDAVSNVSFQIGRDEIVGLIGPNGAGKTTLIRCLIGILKPTSGQVRFKGENITGKRSWDIVNRGMIVTFQVVNDKSNYDIKFGRLCAEHRRFSRTFRQSTTDGGGH